MVIHILPYSGLLRIKIFAQVSKYQFRWFSVFSNSVYFDSFIFEVVIYFEVFEGVHYFTERTGPNPHTILRNGPDHG